MSTPDHAQQPQQAVLAELAYAWGGPRGSARFRAELEDFQVFEDLGFEPDGDGEHLLLQVEKRDDNTEWAARQLARALNVKPSEVGYSGLKDRRALAVQWFSLPRRGTEPEAVDPELPGGLRVLRRAAHRRKLRRGSHRGNRFRILLRDWQGETNATVGVLERIRAQGVPNYFGPQRFGHGGANLARGAAMLAGELQVRQRHLRGLYLSALRSYLFNRLLDQRVATGAWLRVAAGDWLNLAGSASRFRAESDLPGLQQRVDALDLHPTLALWGREEPARPVLLEAEALALADYRHWREGLEQAGLEAERRPVRVVPDALQWRWEAPGLWLEFGLPRGAYATSLVRELIGDQALLRNA